MNFYKINSNHEVLNIQGHQIKDIGQSKEIIKSIRLENNVYYTQKDEIVEVYKYVHLISNIESINKSAIFCVDQLGLSLVLELEKTFLNYKDEFIIYTQDGLPTVLSEVAQNQLFERSDEFSDEDITVNGITYPTPQLLQDNSEISKSEFWSERYKGQTTPWDLNEPSPSLVWALQKFKFPKLRVAVLGCGRGHDAYYFSSLGHMTVGFDFSIEALKEAKNKYGQSANLKWVQQDLFDLDKSYFEQFDLVFDHTMFCAVNPSLRPKLIKVWEKLLTDQGQLLGVFFTMPKTDGPPYGATEAEISERIGSYFRTDFWMRSRVSAPSRLGKELIVLGTKIDI